MNQAEHTFPTLRRWRAMSESEQDALLDKIESRRRWRGIGRRTAIALICVLAAVAVITVAAALHLSH